MVVGGQAGGISVFWPNAVRLGRNQWNLSISSNYSLFSNAKGGRFWPLSARVGTFGVSNTCVESSWGGFMGYWAPKWVGVASASFWGHLILNNILLI